MTEERYIAGGVSGVYLSHTEAELASTHIYLYLHRGDRNY